jgi:hypothetical protein
MRLWMILAILAGCKSDQEISPEDTGGDSDTDEGTVEVDADGDGSPEAEDCDEANPSVYPDAPEVCDTADNNCNGEIDEGAATVDVTLDPYEGGQCSVDSLLAEAAGTYPASVQCGMSAYVACNHPLAEITGWTGDFAEDGCMFVTDPASAGYNETWDTTATTCGWLSGESLAHVTAPE